MLLREVAWEPALLVPKRDAELERWVSGELGLVPDFVRYLAPSPWLVHATVAGIPSQIGLRHLPLEQAELVFLVVSHDNSCRYCYAAHRVMLRIVGFSERRVEQMEQELFTLEDAPELRAALDLARRFSRANPPPRVDGLARGVALEVLLVAAAAVTANRVATIPALPLDAAARPPGGVGFRLLRPLLGRLLRAQQRRARAAAVPVRATPPFAGTWAAFEAVPAAQVLKRAVDECFASEALPAATRALVFGVVARGLGAAAAERESLRLAERAGVDAGAADRALRQLEVPGGGTAEADMLAFARDTLWYEPARLQRRARPLHAALGAERFLDLVGTAGLANALCRLSAVVEPE